MGRSASSWRQQRQHTEVSEWIEWLEVSQAWPVTGWMLTVIGIARVELEWGM